MTAIHTTTTDLGLALGAALRPAIAKPAMPSNAELAKEYGVDASIIEAALVRYANRRFNYYFAKAFEMDVIMARTCATPQTDQQIEANERLFRECRTDGALR